MCVPGTPSRAQRETNRGAGASGAVTCRRAQRQAGQREGAVKKERGQLGWRTARAGGREPGRDREEERQRPRGSSGKGVVVLSSPARARNRPPSRGAAVGRGAARRAEAAPVLSASIYQALTHVSRADLRGNFSQLRFTYIAKWFVDTSGLAVLGTVGWVVSP